MFILKIFVKENTMKTIWLFSLTVTIIYFNVSFTQINETKLVPAAGETSEMFGYSVACDSNFMVIGAPYRDSLAYNSGIAYVYENISGVWTERDILVPNAGHMGQNFGYSVSISDEYILIGAFRDNQNGPQAGAAYVFKRDSASGNWIQLTKLLPADGSAYDEFGTSVCLRGDHAIIGAPFDHENSMEVGSAYIFKWNDTTWVEEAKILASNSVGTSPQFGVCVAIEGDYALVGAWADEGLGSYPGAAYVFHFDGVTWNQQAKLHAGKISLNNFFGRSVSVNGDYAVIGSSRADTTSGGAAFIFHRVDTTWVEEAVVAGHPGFTHARFGESVSIDGDYIVVGASDDDTNGNTAGCIYIFKRDGINWTQWAMLIASDGSEGDWMGWSVFVESDQIFAGAPIQDAGGQYCGAVYVYDGFMTGISDENKSKLPLNFTLEQNYPNPFNPVTTIRFDLPRAAEVRLVVFDVLGREVEKLVNQNMPAGSYDIQWNAEGKPGGIYLYRLDTGRETAVRKMLLVK